MYPIDLVVAVQTSANSGAVLDKLGGSGILFTQLLAADAGKRPWLPSGSERRTDRSFKQKRARDTGPYRNALQPNPHKMD